jgi:hypothetical protein
MRCAECDRDIGPGTREFAVRVLVPTTTGLTVMLCGSCGDVGEPIQRKWALMDDPGALAAVGTAATPKTGFGG